MAKVSLTDWLYNNDYGYIYDAWLTSDEHILKRMSLQRWLKNRYPDIWKEYNER